MGCVVEARLDRADGSAGRGRDLVERQSRVVMEDEDFPLLKGQALEATVKAFSIDDLGRGVGGLEIRDEPHVGPTARSSSLVPACVHHDARGPGFEPSGVAQARQLPPDPLEGILDGVFRPLAVTEDQARDPKQAVTGREHESTEGVVIAAPRPFHEAWIHRLTGLTGRASWARYQS